MLFNKNVLVLLIWRWSRLVLYRNMKFCPNNFAWFALSEYCRVLSDFGFYEGIQSHRVFGIILQKLSRVENKITREQFVFCSSRIHFTPHIQIEKIWDVTNCPISKLNPGPVRFHWKIELVIRNIRTRINLVRNIEPKKTKFELNASENNQNKEEFVLFFWTDSNFFPQTCKHIFRNPLSTYNLNFTMYWQTACLRFVRVFVYSYLYVPPTIARKYWFS